MDILDLLKKYEVSVPEDKVGDFNRDFRTSFKSAAELKKVKDDLAAVQAKVNESSDIETKYNELQTKYNTDIAAKQAEIDGMVYGAKIDKALQGIEFSNDRIKNSVLDEIRQKKFKIDKDGNLEGLNDYLKNLYNSEPDTFKQVDSGIHTWAGGSEGNGDNSKSTSNNLGFKIF